MAEKPILRDVLFEQALEFVKKHARGATDFEVQLAAKKIATYLRSIRQAGAVKRFRKQREAEHG